MKAIAIGEDIRDMVLYADSAIGRDAMPLFVPDGQWTGQLRAAYRIGRLGKNVPARFASRYIDAVGVVLRCVRADAEPTPWIGMMDSALTTGKWIEEDELADHISLSWTVTPLGSDQTMDSGQMKCLDALAAATSAIVSVSDIATVKTGDIIMPDIQAVPVTLARNTRLTVTLNGHECLRLKIK